MFTERFSQIFPQNVLGLDVVSGRIYESQFLSDEEQEVFWFYHQRKQQNGSSSSNTARTKLALQCGWQDGRLFRPTVKRKGK